MSLDIAAVHGSYAARLLWNDFALALGAEATRRAYGPSWPREGVAGELVYVLEEDGDRAAWISVRPDPVEPWAWYAAGVWPKYQRHGVVQQARALARSVARQWAPRVHGLLFEVLDTNRAYQLTLCGEIAAGSELRRAGRIAVPGAEAQLFWLPLEQGIEARA